jgi:hypothetical protein
MSMMMTCMFCGEKTIFFKIFSFIDVDSPWPRGNSFENERNTLYTNKLNDTFFLDVPKIMEYENATYCVK